MSKLTHEELRGKAIEAIAKTLSKFFDPIEWHDLIEEATAALDALDTAGFKVLGRGERVGMYSLQGPIVSYDATPLWYDEYGNAWKVRWWSYVVIPQRQEVGSVAQKGKGTI